MFQGTLERTNSGLFPGENENRKQNETWQYEQFMNAAVPSPFNMIPNGRMNGSIYHNYTNPCIQLLPRDNERVKDVLEDYNRVKDGHEIAYEHRNKNNYALNRFKFINYEVKKEQQEVRVVRLLKVHHVLAILMNKIAPYIKMSMMMFVYKITEELKFLSPLSYGGLQNCNSERILRENQDRLWHELNSILVESKNMLERQKEGVTENEIMLECHKQHHAYPWMWHWVDVWCYLYYKHSYKYKDAKGERDDFERKYMVQNGWVEYLKLLASENVYLYLFPEWIVNATQRGSRYDFDQVKEFCNVYIQSQHRDNEHGGIKTDAYNLLKFAKFCRAAGDAVSREAAMKLIDIRNLLCHRYLDYWTDRKCSEVVEEMKTLMNECRPFKNDYNLLETTLKEIERIKKLSKIADVCKVSNIKPPKSYSAVLSGKHVSPSTANVERSAPSGESYIVQPLHGDRKLEESYRRLLLSA